MSELDMAGGEVSSSDRSITDHLLERERWRHSWATWLTWLSVFIVVLFYGCLLVFIFCGHLWFSFALKNPRVFSMPHTLAEVPIIVALSTVPTLILIALLRYFHTNEKKASDDSPDIPTAPVIVQIGKEVLRAINQRP